MSDIFTRATALGAVLGTVVGASVATVLFAIFGTVFGGLAGAAIGAALGMCNGLALTLVDRSGGGRWWGRAIAALTSAACALVGALIYGHGRFPGQVAWLWLVAGCALVGALFGPAALLGLQPVTVGRKRRGLQDAASRVLVQFLVIGSALGAAVGLVIGLRTYAPSSPVAAVEGAMFGATGAGVLYSVVALLCFVPRIRSRR